MLELRRSEAIDKPVIDK